MKLALWMVTCIQSLAGKGAVAIRGWFGKPRNWPEWTMILVTIGILWYAKVQSGIAAQQASILSQQTQILNRTVEMARSDQRAWVGAVDPVAVQLKDSSMRVSVTIRNFGRTPALDVVPQLHLRTLEPSESFEPDAPTRLANPKTRAALQPGQDFTLGPEEVPPISKDLADRLNAGTTQFHAYGEIFYHDAFGESHCTTFAYAFVPKLSTWRVLHKYNDAS